MQQTNDSILRSTAPRALAPRCSPARACGCAPRRWGFSLTEILVMISIIFILMGLGVTAYTKINDHAIAQQTKTLLAELRVVASEYQTVTGSPVIYTADTTDAASIKRFVEDAKEVPTCNALLERLRHDKRLDYDINTNSVVANDTVYDYWDIVVQYRSSATYAGKLPASSTPYFASAGQDAKFGNAYPTPDTNSADNLYSFKIE